MTPEALARIERWNYVLAALAVAATLIVCSRAVSAGVAVGAAVGCVNFSLIRRLVGRWLRAAADRRGTTALLFIPKMMGLIGVVFLAIRYVPMNPAAFAIGFSIFFVSIAIETVRFAMTGSLQAH